LDITQFIPVFGNVAWTIAAFVIALSVIVAIHEYGHYIVGRWSGIDAEVFSLGFGPVLLSGHDKRGTKWQLAAIPLGGYVKFLGDANAASVGGEKGARNTMLGAPVWARALTVAAGPVFNFMLTLVIFFGMAMWLGIPRDPLTLRSVPVLPPTYVQELQPGDAILAIEGVEARSVQAFAAALEDLPVQRALDYLIERDGSEMVVQGPYPETTRVNGVNHDTAAEDAGVQEGDVIMAINGQEVYAFPQMVEIVNGSDGAELTLDIWRGGNEVQITLTPRSTDLPQPDGSFETRWLMGVTGGLYFDPETRQPGLWEAASASANQLWYVIKVSLSGMWKMLTGVISTCNLSSPVGIAEASGAMASAGLADFISFIGFLSAAVGLLNLLPIPILDGGHLVFHAYEAVRGKPPADKALQVFMAVGLALIGTLMVFALLNDIILCP
jgi:regulator of sigma E protease